MAERYYKGLYTNLFNDVSLAASDTSPGVLTIVCVA